MKIVDIGICVNNIDPKGIGRIRYRTYGMFVSEVENGVKYDDWDENDPFLALPFLPAHINIIPQVQQSVKLIKYDTNKDTQNVEYIGGPYTSPHDLENQTFVSQHKDTTYGGVIVKGLKDIRNKNGVFNSPVSPGTMPNSKDTGFRGNYGSDVIFTENGVQIRGGMLLSKQQKNRPDILDYPQMAKKMGRFNLKKFPKTLRSIKETVESSKVAVSRLKYIIEYELDNLTLPNELKLYVYKVVGNYGVQFNTDVFGETSVFDTGNTELVKLITTGTTLSYAQALDGTLRSSYVELRELLHLIGEEGLTELDATYPDEDVHPFYFRPTDAFRLNKGTTPTEVQNKATFLSKVEYRKKVGSGLIFSRQSSNPPIITSKKTVDNAIEIKGAGEQSFSNLSSDNVYILSTSPNVGVNVKSINFNELDEYELTQEDYISRIHPNTYAMVRGENLYNLLIALKKAFDSHVHNINDPPVQTEDNYIQLNKLMDTVLDDILNNSLRIN
jgi:hypothetical protein